MRVIAFAAVLLGTACAPPPLPPVSAAQQARCTYEARAATAGIRSGLDAGWTRYEVERDCIRAAAAQNAERP